jgi:hypothetical protein
MCSSVLCHRLRTRTSETVEAEAEAALGRMGLLLELLLGLQGACHSDRCLVCILIFTLNVLPLPVHLQWRSPFLPARVK